MNLQADADGRKVTGLSSLCVGRIVKELGALAADSEVRVHCGGSVVTDKPTLLFTGARQFGLPLSQDDLKQLKTQRHSKKRHYVWVIGALPAIPV